MIDTDRFEASKHVAFNFARDLRRADVRAQLKRLGFDGDAGHVVVPWRDGETEDEAAARVSDGRRPLLVKADPAQPTGWLMRWGRP